MEYSFIKDIFKSVLNDLRSDNSTLESFLAERENFFILKHNIDALSQILRFLNSSDNIFILVSSFNLTLCIEITLSCIIFPLISILCIFAWV